jgi:hypothetical protein
MQRPTELRNLEQGNLHTCYFVCICSVKLKPSLDNSIHFEGRTQQVSKNRVLLKIFGSSGYYIARTSIIYAGNLALLGL